MCRKLLFLTVLALVLGIVSADVAHAAKPKLIGWWKFDEGTGMVAADSSGLGNDGTLGTLPVSAVNSLCAAVFGMMTENADIIGEQG